MERDRGGPIDCARRVREDTDMNDEANCRHHWVLGQPENGATRGKCRDCGMDRSFPAFLDEYDWGTESERRYNSMSVATAAGGARPSSGALRVDHES